MRSARDRVFYAPIRDDYRGVHRILDIEGGRGKPQETVCSPLQRHDGHNTNLDLDPV